MNKEQQIEEMANDIELMPWRIEQDWVGCRISNNTELAKYFYYKGYRKIPTTDWLTKGISEEELEREKQEALDEFAENLGYRKQIEGKWSTRLYSQMDKLDTYSHTCSECNYFYKDIRHNGYDYCPKCGAKMTEADNV